MKTPSPDDPLAEAFRAWPPGPDVPADFSHRVWQRIAARQAAREENSLSAWLGRAGAFFLRPAVAGLALLASILGGWGLAQWEARRVNERSWHQMEERYAMAVNPLVRQVDHLNHFAP